MALTRLEFSFVATVVFLSLALMGQTQPHAATERDCSHRELLNTDDLYACESEDLMLAETEMNKMLAGVEKYVSDSEKTFSSHEQHYSRNLKLAQQHWLVYRENECALAGFYAPGSSLEPLLSLDCTLNMTRERTKALGATLPKR